MRLKKRKIEPISVKKFVDDYILRIDLDADYQREKIWTRKNQEDLLDSIWQDIDIPKLYLVETNDESFDYECIDGKQRMNTLRMFFDPDDDNDSPLTVRVAGHKFTYRALKKAQPTIAKQMEDFELTVVIYPEKDDELIREIFRRLQLGIPLNSGERLKSYTGTIRDFIFKEMGSNAPFLRHTALSERRFSRQFTLAQICINSFKRSEDDFVRARFNDLEDFFRENADLNPKDSNFGRIRSVLKLMERDFIDAAPIISSRAVAVTAYFFVEDLYNQEKENLVSSFADFFCLLLDKIKEDLKRLSKYEEPSNPLLLDEFQKNISQASVEPYAIKRRHEFLKRAFEHFLNPKTKGRILK